MLMTTDSLIRQVVLRGLAVDDFAASPDELLQQRLADHYSDLPAPLREAYLLDRIARLTAERETGNRTLQQALADLAELGRAHAAQLAAADSDTQTRMRLERQIIALHARLTAEAADRAALIQTVDDLRAQLDAERASVAALTRLPADAPAEQVEIVGAAAPEFDPPPAEPDALRCPYCHATHSAKNQRPFTTESLPRHIRRCPSNPDRWTPDQATPATLVFADLPEPEPEPEPLPERMLLLDTSDLYTCPVCGGTAFARAIRGDRCVRCAKTGGA